MPSNWTAAFTHPDPLDPNDAQRQRTQAAPKDYPYDKPTSYGNPIGTSGDGSSYQRSPDLTPPKPRHKRPGDVMPYGQYGTAWEQLEALTDPYQNGPQADDAAALGYGNRGRMGEDGLDPGELDLDMLRRDFRDSFVSTRPKAHSLGSKGLFTLLVQLDPEWSAELFAPDDDSEMSDIYDDWGQHVYAPGAEFDEEDPEDEDLYY